MSIQTNIAEIRSRIAAACAESGREAGEITLVGASKMNDAAACREAIAGGQGSSDPVRGVPSPAGSH